MTGPTNEQQRNDLGRAGQGSPLLGRVGAEESESRDRRSVPADPRPDFSRHASEDQRNVSSAERRNTARLPFAGRISLDATVTCKNPTCKATVPLVKQTWLCKKNDRYVALKVHCAGKARRESVSRSSSPARRKGLGFRPRSGIERRKRDLPLLRNGR